MSHLLLSLLSAPILPDPLQSHLLPINPVVNESIEPLKCHRTTKYHNSYILITITLMTFFFFLFPATFLTDTVCSQTLPINLVVTELIEPLEYHITTKIHNSFITITIT